MDIRVDDILLMRKKHPCGSHENSDKMRVLRTGMDLRLRCEGCSHTFMITRSKIEKNIKSIIRNNDTEENN